MFQKNISEQESDDGRKDIDDRGRSNGRPLYSESEEDDISRSEERKQKKLQKIFLGKFAYDEWQNE